ncbi:MAG: hypothetical protein JNM17_12400 [Archangium sp.]|nr:hypothetical protein [Archangium sp.]
MVLRGSMLVLATLLIACEPPSPQPKPFSVGPLENEFALVGAFITLSIHAEGPEPISYRWIHAGVTRGTEATVEVGPVVQSDFGSWSCVVSSGSSSVTQTIELIEEFGPRPFELQLVAPDFVEIDRPAVARAVFAPGTALEWSVDGARVVNSSPETMEFSASQPGRITIRLLGSLDGVRFLVEHFVFVIAPPSRPDIFAQRSVFRSDATAASTPVCTHCTVTWAVSGDAQIVGPADQPVVRYRSPSAIGPFDLTATITSAAGTTVSQTVSQQVVANVWLKNPREPRVHSEADAVRLPNGRVLITGSSYLITNPAIAELYDPATDTFTDVADMANEHSHHASVALDDGRVMVIGGRRRQAVETFDPTTNSWTPGPDFPELANHQPRVHQGVNASGAVIVRAASSTLWELGSFGWVLAPVSGSCSLTVVDGKAVASAPDGLWIRESSGWRNVPTTAPCAPIAPTGASEVLVVNPSGSWLVDLTNGATASVSAALPFTPETFDWLRLFPVPGGAVLRANYQIAFFDRATSTWSTSVSGHFRPAIASLMDGRLLEVGMSGGATAGRAFHSLYDPRANTLKMRPLNAVAAVTEAGHVVIRYENTLSLIELASGTWTELDAAPEGEMIALGNGHVLFANSTPSVLSVASKQWRPISALDSLSAHRSARLDDGRIFVLGNEADGSAVRLFDPVTERWTVVPSLPSPVETPAVISIDGARIVVAGGTIADNSVSVRPATNLVQVFDLGTATWTSGQLMPAAHGFPNTVRLDAARTLFSRTGTGAPTQLDSSATLWWSTLPGPVSPSPADFPRALMASLPSGRLLIVDEPNSCQCTTSGKWTHVYDAVSGTDDAHFAAGGRAGSSLVSLPDGRVMGFGGVGRNAGFVEFFKE